MGLTELALEVGNPATPQETTRLEFLVDSGAIYDGSSVVCQRGYALGLDPLRRELIPLPMVL